jgi:outer membrane protein assembly factor BamB
MLSPLRALPLLLLCASAALAANWPAWRGPTGDGRSAENDAPITWSRTENVRWKAPLPSEGNSTPIVWGDRVFLTQSIDRKGTRRAVLCFDRAGGKLLWQRETPYAEDEPKHATNPYCSASPVTDGERVIASLGSAGVVCYDFAGKQLWRKDLGKLYSVWGNASSPVLYKDLVLLWCGPGERQFLIALNKATGEQVWKHDEPGGKFGSVPADWLGTWSTPLVVRAGDHDELILPVPHKVKGFDPATGKVLWWCEGVGPLVYTSPVCSADGVAVVMSGFHGPALAVRVGGKGDVTKTHRLWQHGKGQPQRVGSPVIVGEHLYLLNENAVAVCLEVKTGKTVWKDRLPGASWSSPVAVGDRLYVTNHAGDCHVIAASPRFRQLAVNSLGERVLSSVAVSEGELFVRSYKHLWCIAPKGGNPKSESRNPKQIQNPKPQ